MNASDEIELHRTLSQFAAQAGAARTCGIERPRTAAALARRIIGTTAASVACT